MDTTGLEALWGELAELRERRDEEIEHQFILRRRRRPAAEEPAAADVYTPEHQRIGVICGIRGSFTFGVHEL